MSEPPNTLPAAPDWGTQSEEIHCPLCGYNLRGLAEPRCPECGYTFEWADLTDPHRRRHAYLFEHHPRRNIWSMVRTVWGQLVPGRFWRSVKPEMPSNRRRLALYAGVICLGWMIWALLPVPVELVHSGLSQLHTRESARKQIPPYVRNVNGQTIISRYGSIENYIDQIYPSPLTTGYWKSNGGAILEHSIRSLPYSWRFTVPFVLLLLPLLMLLVMSVFQVSMRQASVLRIHVMRILTYSSDGIMVLLLISLAIQSMELVQHARIGSYDPRPFMRTELLATVGLTTVFAWRVITGYALYLRFRHSAGTVIAAMAIAMLVMACVVFYSDPIMELLTRQWLELRTAFRF